MIQSPIWLDLFVIYFQNNGYTQIDTPIISGNDCEGAGEVFQVEASISNTIYF